jgi:hypothetical protein
MSRLFVLACSLSALALAAAGCETHDAAAAPPAAPHQATTAPDDHQLCVQMQTRARACTDTYIPALVDARAALDHPAGIADAVKQDRDGVIKQAMAEWANDSTDAAIEAHCAGPFPGDPSDRDTAQGCLAQADCTGFTSCGIPLVAKYFAKQ